MKVNLLYPFDCQLDIDVPDRISAQKLKQKISEMLNITHEKIQIIFNQKEIEDDKVIDNEDLEKVICTFHNISEDELNEISKPSNEMTEKINYLTNMGFQEDYVRKALDKTNNNTSDALQILIQKKSDSNQNEIDKNKREITLENDETSFNASTNSNEIPEVSLTSLRLLNIQSLITKCYECNFRWEFISPYFRNFSTGYLNFVLVYVHRELCNRINKEVHSKWEYHEEKLIFEQIHSGTTPEDLAKCIDGKTPREIQLHLKNIDYSLKNTILLLMFAEQFSSIEPKSELNEEGVPSYIDALISQFDVNEYKKHIDEHRTEFREKLSKMQTKYQTKSPFKTYKILPEKALNPISVDISKRWNGITDIKSANMESLSSVLSMPDEEDKIENSKIILKPKPKDIQSSKKISSESEDTPAQAKINKSNAKTSKKIDSEDLPDHKPTKKVSHEESKPKQKDTKKSDDENEFSSVNYVWSKEDEHKLLEKAEEYANAKNKWQSVAKDIDHTIEACQRMYSKLTNTPLNGWTFTEDQLLIEKYEQCFESSTKWEDLSNAVSGKSIDAVRKRFLGILRFILREPKSNIYYVPPLILEILDRKERCPWNEELDQILIDINNEYKDSPQLQHELQLAFPNRTLSAITTHYRKIMQKRKKSE